MCACAKGHKPSPSVIRKCEMRNAKCENAKCENAIRSVVCCSRDWIPLRYASATLNLNLQFQFQFRIPQPSECARADS